MRPILIFYDKPFFRFLKKNMFTNVIELNSNLTLSWEANDRCWVIVLLSALLCGA